MVSPAAPESIELGLENLNSMLELWLSRNIILGTTPLEAPADELNEPNDVRNGIISNLALYMAADFDNGKDIVSQELKNAASRDFIQIKALYQKLSIPDKVVSSTLPRGAGNDAGFRSRTFFAKDETIEN